MVNHLLSNRVSPLRMSTQGLLSVVVMLAVETLILCFYRYGQNLIVCFQLFQSVSVCVSKFAISEGRVFRPLDSVAIYSLLVECHLAYSVVSCFCLWCWFLLSCDTIVHPNRVSVTSSFVTNIA